MTNEKFDFGKAIQKLKEGKKVARTGWNGKGIYLELQRPDEHSKMTLPYSCGLYTPTSLSAIAQIKLAFS